MRAHGLTACGITATTENQRTNGDTLDYLGTVASNRNTRERAFLLARSHRFRASLDNEELSGNSILCPFCT